MGFFGSLIKVAAPIVGGLIGGPAGAAIGSGVAGLIGGKQKASQQTQTGAAAGQTAMNTAAAAGQTAMGGFNYMQNSPIGSQYLPAGAAALGQEQALLGIGGDPAAAQAGYDNYLNSIGFQGQLRAGQQAITGSAAARGLLGSGSTLKALQAHGQQLGQQSFQNYLGNLRGISNMGLQAGSMMGNAASNAYGQAAQMQYGAGQQAAQYQYGSGQQAVESNASGWDALLGGLGAGFDAWQAGRSKTTPMATPAGPAPHVAPIAPISTAPFGRGAQPILR